MRKYKGIFAVMVLMALFFCSGYYSALHFNKVNFNKVNTEKTGKEQKADEVRDRQEMEDAKSVAEQQDEKEKTKPPAEDEREESEQTVKTAGSGGWVEKEDTWDQEFEELLEKHVFGDWRFSRRIGMNNDGRVYAGEWSNHYNAVDFSEQGVEEMKKIIMHYGRDSAGVTGGLYQTTFSNPIDMYLFGANAGGFRNISQPSYALGVGTDYHHLVVEDCPSVEELVPICYADKSAGWEDLAKTGWNDIYVNPEDTDTLYVDFCGLWELKRAGKELAAMDVGCEADITDEEKEFLEKHVYGKWEFYKRLYKLNEDESGDDGIKVNFSDQGVNELMSGEESFVSFEETFGRIYCGQAALSNPGDVYLRCIYMKGLYWYDWHVWGEVDAGNLRIRNAFRAEDDYVSLEGKDKLVEISGDNGYEESSFYGYYGGSHLYADPEDTETLYLDFCGLWELKRAN